MPASNAMSYSDKVVHIMGTYALPLPSAVLESMRQDVRDADPSGHQRLAEEEAAIFLARNLHAMVMTELHSGIDSRSMGGVLDAWSKFAQQAMYRTDLGLINMVLYTYEILPLIDDVERLLREAIPEGDVSKTQSSPRMSGVPL
jgi:hypothetical protein